VVALVCSMGGRAHASESRPRQRAADRFKPSVGEGRKAEFNDPLDSLRRTSQALGDVLRRRVPDWSPEADASKGRVDAILAGMLDYEEIARRALNAEWNNLTEAQRREFLATFSALTNRAFVAAINRREVHLTFDSETVQGQVASVLVTAWASKPTPDSEERMEYRLARKGDRWLVCDVLVENVSLVDGYRDQFARLIHRGGFAELIERMHHKLETSPRY
jgi:phospholipid transport system substrate-binding protein